MNIRTFARMGAKARWEKMTPDQRKKHIANMTRKSLESRARNKAKKTPVDN